MNYKTYIPPSLNITVEVANLSWTPCGDIYCPPTHFVVGDNSCGYLRHILSAYSILYIVAGDNMCRYRPLHLVYAVNFDTNCCRRQNMPSTLKQTVAKKKIKNFYDFKVLIYYLKKSQHSALTW